MDIGEIERLKLAVKSTGTHSVVALLVARLCRSTLEGDGTDGG